MRAGSLPAWLPILFGERPALVIAPLSADPQVLRRVPLVAKAEALHERLRSSVSRLNVGFESMKAILPECAGHDASKSFAHVTPSSVGQKPIVAEIAGTERAANDFIDVDDPGERAVGRDHEVADMRRPATPPDVGAILLERCRRRSPRIVQGAADGDGGQKSRRSPKRGALETNGSILHRKPLSTARPTRATRRARRAVRRRNVGGQSEKRIRNRRLGDGRRRVTRGSFPRHTPPRSGPHGAGGRKRGTPVRPRGTRARRDAVAPRARARGRRARDRRRHRRVRDRASTATPGGDARGGRRRPRRRESTRPLRRRLRGGRLRRPGDAQAGRRHQKRRTAGLLENAGQTRHEGVEASARIRLGRALSLPVALDVGAAYTFSRAMFTNGPYAGNLLPYAPLHTASAVLEVVHPAGVGAELAWTRVGQQFADSRGTVAVNASGTVGVIAAYDIVDANVRYPHTPTGLTRLVSAKALADSTYVSSRRPDGTFTGPFSTDHRWRSLGVEVDGGGPRRGGRDSGRTGRGRAGAPHAERRSMPACFAFEPYAPSSRR